MKFELLLDDTISSYIIFFFLIDYSKIISNQFKFINYHFKTIKSDHFKIISDHFKVINNHFKTINVYQVSPIEIISQ